MIFRLIKRKGPVVYLDRLPKARMIEAILADYLGHPVKGYKILDIGCGNGDISEYFAQRNDQCGLDVSDRRRAENNSFLFTLVNSEHLPFGDNFFDIVISHHVIEHVADQDLHLQEMQRVVKDKGIVYLATPNKSSPLMEGHLNNDKVLSFCNMRPIFERNGFRSHEYAIRLIKNPKRFQAPIRWAIIIPLPLLRLLRPLFPAHVFILEPLGRKGS